jgi:two-component system, chemotaxis family, sensor kinase CheA
MDPMESIKATFFQECEELLGDLETGLLRLEAGEGDEDTVNAIFRAVHSVKGGAGAFGLDDLVGFAHVFETSMDMMRSGELQPDATNVAILLRAGDILADLVAAAKGGPDVDRERQGVSQEELESLTGAVAGSDPAVDEEIEGLDFCPAMISLDDDDEKPGTSDGPSGWRITFRPASDMYTKANDAALLLRELERLGPCRITVDTSALPGFDDLEAEASYLVWTVELTGDINRAAVEEVFEFVEDDCELSIEALSSDGSTLSEPEAGLNVSELLEQAQAAAPDIPVDVPDDPEPEAPVDQDKADPPADAMKKTAIATAPPATIRVDLDRVDRLIDLVGELVINQAMLAERVNENMGDKDSAQVSMALDDLEQLTREIQDSCMAIRAQPVKSVFQRMPRLVRETAAMVKKKVRLVTEGEGTEVDKTVIERLTEPLTHMVRNAIDHGLETPEDRAAAGKPEEGVVRLAALHRSGRIVIEISDDGRGINRDKVRQKAV